jgi:hypothetical protein
MLMNTKIFKTVLISNNRKQFKKGGRGQEINSPTVTSLYTGMLTAVTEVKPDVLLKSGM